MTTTYETVKLTIICLILSLACNFQFGFSSTYLNTSVDEFRIYLNESWTRRGARMSESTYSWLWNAIVNIWFIGYLFGIGINPFLNDRFGRRPGFLLSAALSLGASVLRFLAVCVYVPELLFVGRFVAAVSMAIGDQCLILFLQECTPTRLRGSLSFTAEVTYSGMSLLGMFLGTHAMLGSDLRILLGFAIPFCLAALFSLFPMHETPKFLLLVRNDRARAAASIRFYHGASADVDAVLKEIAIEGAQEGPLEQQGKWVRFKEVLTRPHLRKSLLLAVLTLQNTTAMWAVLLLSTDFLGRTGLSSTTAQWASTGVTLAYVSGAVAGFPWVEKFGRRPVLFTFASINNVCLVLYVVFAALQPMVAWFKYGCLSSLVVFGFTFGCGVGPVTWLLVAELAPQRHRAIVHSLVYAFHNLVVEGLDFGVLPLFHAIHAYALLLLYVLPSSVSLLLLARWLPETGGREIHAIVQEMRETAGAGEQRRLIHDPSQLNGEHNAKHCQH